MKQAINGVVLLNKASGMSSNKALQKVKYLFVARKAGHTGSLDPLASGMLPICLGEATKFAQFMLDADKQYLVTARLGERTSTADSEGEVIATAPVPELNQAQLEAVLQKLRGPISQVPPMYSALKHQGQPLYKLARKGKEIERAPRKVTIHELEYLSHEAAQLCLRVHCSKGTYVRTLVDDLGQMLGCGAHMTALQRTHVAEFKPQQMLSFTQLQDLAQAGNLRQALLPVDTMLQALPTLALSTACCRRLAQGQVVSLDQGLTPGLRRLLQESEQFIGIGEVMADGRIVPKRLLQALALAVQAKA